MAWLVDEYIQNIVGMMLTGKWKNSEENCPSVTLFTTEPIWTGMTLNRAPFFSSFVFLQLLIVIRTCVFRTHIHPDEWQFLPVNVSLLFERCVL
jgi:hypothetical protein